MRCPSCDYDNIPGDDFCGECGLDLAGLDIKGWGIGTDEPLLNHPVSELPLKKALCLSSRATSDEAIALMADRREGCVFVTDESGSLCGVLTERDVALRIATRRRAPPQIPISEVMTRDPLTLQSDDSFAFALNRMGVDGFRHIPIVDDGELRGFISSRTILAVLAKHANDS